MKRCVQCQAGALLTDRVSENAREVAGHLFLAYLPARSCPRCDKVYFDSAVLERFELHIASKLIDAGRCSGDVFRFMRKALGIRAAELAELLDVAPETISRWETDKRALDRGAWVVLGTIVRDALEGRTSTLDALRALRKPLRLAKTVRLDLGADLDDAAQV